MAAPGPFAIEVNFLMGFYTATSHNDRRRGEWPPDPARLFSALVATWADRALPDSSERQALEWLEDQRAPAIATSDAVPRRVLSHFVPVNDASVVSRALQERRAAEVYELMDLIEDDLGASGGEVTKAIGRLQERLAQRRDVGAEVSKTGSTSADSALAMLPEWRGKQERSYPTMCPTRPRVTYIWSRSPSDDKLRALDELLPRVTRLGHSSSLVSCRVVANPPDPTHTIATDGGGTGMRAVRHGQLAELQRRHALHEGLRPRSLPYTSVRYQSVASASPPEPQPLEPNTLGEWIVFRFVHDSRTLPATRSVELATAMRGAVFRYIEDPIPEAISGHRADGSPTLSPHVSIVPIPYVGFPHADGRLLGIAVSIPAAIERASRTALYRAVGTWERTVRERSGSPGEALRLTLGRRGTVRLTRVVGTPDLMSLRPGIWHRSASRWVSAIAVALPRHPGSLTKGTATARARAWARAEVSVRQACAHVGLPEPAAVSLSSDPSIRGAPRAAHFPPFLQTGHQGRPVRRQLVHVALTFEDSVRGPLMLGAGRFFGLGLMRPMPERPSPRPAGESADG